MRVIDPTSGEPHRLCVRTMEGFAAVYPAAKWHRWRRITLRMLAGIGVVSALVKLL